MRRVLTPPNDIAARDRPDSSIQATARISAGTELVETERLGDWSHVTTPDGRELWVDARRLETVGTIPDEETLPQEPVPKIPTPRSRPWRLAVLGLAILAGGSVTYFYVAGNRDSHPTAISNPPTDIKGWIDLQFEPVSAFPTSYWSYHSYVLGEDHILALWPPNPAGSPADVNLLRAVKSDPADGLRPQDIAVPFAEDFIVVLDAGNHLVSLGDLDLHQLRPSDGSVRPDVLVEDDIAPFVALPGTRGLEVMVMFGLNSGLADRILIFDALTLESIDEYLLPKPIQITATLASAGRFYVGHSEGILIYDTWDVPNTPPNLLSSMAFPTVALAWARPTYEPGDIDYVFALDAEGESILVLEDRASINFEPLARIDLVAVTGGNHDYTLSLAAVGQYAYVITTQGDLLVIDATPDDNIASQNRLVGIVENLGSSSSDYRRLIGLDASWGDPNRGVLVSDPERQRLWWIASGVDDGRNLEIPLVMSKP